MLASNPVWIECVRRRIRVYSCCVFKIIYVLVLFELSFTWNSVECVVFLRAGGLGLGFRG